MQVARVKFFYTKVSSAFIFRLKFVGLVKNTRRTLWGLQIAEVIIPKIVDSDFLRSHQVCRSRKKHETDAMGAVNC